MKSLLRFLLFVLFFVSFSYFTLVFSLNQTVLSGTYLKNVLAKKEFYARLYAAIPEIVDFVSGEESAASDQNTITPNQLGKIILAGTDASILKIKSEKLIDDFDSWLKSSTGSDIVIRLDDIKPKLFASEAAELAVPMDLITSGQLGLQIPDTYKIPMPQQLLTIRSLKQAGSKYLLLSLLVSIASLVGFTLLKTGSWAYKLRSFGEALFLTGLLILIFFGSFWVFFAAGDMLYKQLAGSIKISQSSITYLYSVLRSILDDFEIKALTGPVIFIFLGLSSWIFGGVLVHKEKKNVKPFVEQKEQAVEASN